MLDHAHKHCTATATQTLSKAQLEGQHRMLTRLKAALGGLESGGMGPVYQRAVLIMTAVLGLGAVLIPFGIAGGLTEGYGIVLTGALAFGAGLTYVFKAKGPQTWNEELDARLAQYTPLHREALVELQNKIREAGYVETVVVRAWLDEELERFELLRKRCYGEKAELFLSKQL